MGLIIGLALEVSQSVGHSSKISVMGMVNCLETDVLPSFQLMMVLPSMSIFLALACICFTSSSVKPLMKSPFALISQTQFGLLYW